MAAKGAQTFSAKGSGAASKVAVAERAEPRRLAEPVWLVRVVLILFLVGFASFLAREVYNLIGWL